MSATKEHHHDKIEAGQRGKQHPISWLNMPGFKPKTWNPIIGCSEKSEGCKHCFAKTMAFRLMHMPHTSYYHHVLADNGETDPEKFRNIPQWNGKTHFVKSALDKPLKWKNPRMIFTVDMGDLFHETVSTGMFQMVLDRISRCRQHIFIMLTKRPENVMPLLKYVGWGNPLPPNVWLGCTVENQEQANKRIPILLQIPAAKRFVSIEPMLGPVDVTDIKYFNAFNGDIKLNSLKGYTMYESINSGMPCVTDCEKLDWVICGGETGPKARPMHPDWVRSLRDQCKAADVPFFFKQWGKYYTHWANMTTWKDEFKMYESYPQFTQKLWVKKGDVLVDMDGNYPKTGGDMQTAKYPVAIMNPISVKYDILDGQQYHEWPKTVS